MSDEPCRDWMVDALCRDYPEIDFFPADSLGVPLAQKVCRRCPVVDECLEYALETHQFHGVWGGVSERERVRIRRARSAALRSV